MSLNGSKIPHCLQVWRSKFNVLLHPWDFPGKNTGMGCHSLLQGIFLTQGPNLRVSFIASRFFTIWANREDQVAKMKTQIFLDMVEKKLLQHEKSNIRTNSALEKNIHFLSSWFKHRSVKVNQSNYSNFNTERTIKKKKDCFRRTQLLACTFKGVYSYFIWKAF